MVSVKSKGDHMWQSYVFCLVLLLIGLVIAIIQKDKNGVRALLLLLGMLVGWFLFTFSLECVT